MSLYVGSHIQLFHSVCYPGEHQDWQLHEECRGGDGRGEEV